ncbi:MAG: DUF3048 C-terminal domain-containing protein [Anaerolineales bacterium]|nr:DUF3048 C-terminal domain-containing protein [Anaerolineales bacterium]
MKKIIPSMLVLVMLLSACSSVASTPEAVVLVPDTPTLAPTATAVPPTETAVPTEAPTPTQDPSPANYGPVDFPAGINPLTGLPVADPTLLERRPISVKIQMFPRGDRPPFGLSFADIVYDYYQNNGMTRFNAIFYGQDSEQVGPIRSARLLDKLLVTMYKANFVFGSADQKILNRIYNSDFYERTIVETPNNCPPLCRYDPNGYNYLMLNTTEVGAFMTAKGVNNGRQDLTGMTFQYQTPPGGSLGNQVLLRYSISAYARWDYDAASGRYLRFQDTTEAMDATTEVHEPLIDRLTEQQLGAENVVVLLVKHSYIYKSGNSEVIEIDLIGTGKAFAFRDGQIFEVQWNRLKSEDLLTLTNPDGTPFPLKQGVTWYQPIGLSTIMRQLDTGGWRFEMGFP